MEVSRGEEGAGPLGTNDNLCTPGAKAAPPRHASEPKVRSDSHNSQGTGVMWSVGAIRNSRGKARVIMISYSLDECMPENVLKSSATLTCSLVCHDSKFAPK